jgi:hypothetical protein
VYGVPYQQFHQQSRRKVWMGVPMSNWRSTVDRSGKGHSGQELACIHHWSARSMHPCMATSDAAKRSCPSPVLDPKQDGSEQHWAVYSPRRMHDSWVSAGTSIFTYIGAQHAYLHTDPINHAPHDAKISICTDTYALVYIFLITSSLINWNKSWIDGM